jgi:predicted aldo/keto reductase-like oxidoreductase
MLGKVIRDMGVRGEVVVATKVMTPNLRRGLDSVEAGEKFIHMVETSLEFLKMEYVDIVYLHDVSTAGDVRFPGIQDAMAKLKKDGKVRFVGFTTHQNMAACIEEAIPDRFYDVILTSYNVALANDQRLLNAMKKAHEQGIGLIAMKTQCSQYWYKQNLPEGQKKYYEGTILNSAVLKWVMRHPFIATSIPGVTAFQHVDDDFAVARDLVYTPEEAQFLKERDIQALLGVCRQCRWCVSTCPGKTEIPSLMRTHMYSFCYHNTEQASETLKNLPDGKGIRSCVRCDKCQARCRYALDIQGRIKELIAVSV